MVNNQNTIQSPSPPGIAELSVKSVHGTALPSDGFGAGNDDGISAEEFEKSFGEDIRHTLDVNTWRVGNDLSQEYSRIEREVRDAVQREGELHTEIRSKVFPRLKVGENLPKNAGVHPAKMDIIKQIHQGLLFNGGVEACDGNIRIHFTTPLTIYQIGVSLVSYQGNQGTWCQRLFHHDLRQKSGDLIKELLDVLERRSQRTNERSGMGELVQKAMMDYGERAILLRRSEATWRMGHGNPVTYEMLTGGGNLHLMMESTNVLRELIERHQKFVFVASEPRDHLLMTLGQALRPMEFAIVRTLDEELQDWLHQQRFAVNVGHELTWDAEPIQPTQWIPRFIKTVASKVVVGLFRATHFAPAQKFYAHVDHADLAAHIVLADSMMQEHRGFPLLADMARRVCHTEFGETLEELAETAYAAAGAPWRYSSERSARNR
jgi:hypothetical protein